MTRILLIAFLVACGGSSASPKPDASPMSDGGIDPPPYRCDFADCKDGFARTCNAEPQTLDCSAFGASCGAFTDTESGAPFNWCDCGTVAEGDGFCTGGRYGVVCLDGLGGQSDCGEGFLCVPRPNGPFGIGCECNNIADGNCPATSCSSDPDCATCTPSCAGKACGDNGCGGECGTCDLGDECTPEGTCEPICVPNCTDKTCGDDGCGGSCGTCDGTCQPDGTCQGTCVPDCAGAVCGNDGCGGSCGTCSDPDLECGLNGQCECGFFDVLNYKFTLPPESAFPAQFQAVTVNVNHIKLDGTEDTTNGEFMGFGPNDKQVFNEAAYGCKPKIRVRRDYAVNFRSCTADEIVTGREEIEIKVPIVNPDGSCTAPPL